MKKALKIAAVVIAVAFIVIQFIPSGISNPPVVQADTLQASMTVPPEVDAILARSCADCHSNNTRLPWYSYVAPVSWWLSDHIRDGRRHLNTSEWNKLDPGRKAKRLGEVCEQVESGEMPLPSYLWIHRDAVLTETDKKTLCDWAHTEAQKAVAQ